MTVSRQFVVFICGGLVCAALDVGTMQFLIANGVNPLISATGGFWLALVINYIFHANITFGSTTTISTLVKFFSIVSLNYVITIGFVFFFTVFFNDALIGKIASLPVVAINGFWLSKRWAFE